MWSESWYFGALWCSNDLKSEENQHALVAAWSLQTKHERKPFHLNILKAGR